MATLTNTKIKDTYVGLLKTTDNQAIDASGVTLVEDGAGNASALSVGRSGNGVTITGTITGDLSGNVTGNLTGTVLTAAQPNITSVGTLSSLDVNSGANNDVATFTSTDSTASILLNDNVGSVRFRQSGADFFIENDYDNTVADSDIVFRIDNSEKLRIDSNGQLGLGTSSPDAELEIASSAPQVRFTDTDGGYCDIANISGNLFFQADKGNTEASSTMRFEIDGDEKMRIDSSGYVGIGESNPNRQVHITNSAGSVYLKLEAGTTNNSAIEFGDSDTANIGRIQYDHSDDSMEFRVNGSERMRIDSSGNVGINASPFTRFTVVGNSAFSPSASGGKATEGIHIRATAGASGNYGAGISLDTGSVGASAIVAVQESADADVNGLAFFTHSSGTGADPSTERMRIDSSGYVGIGESVPLVPLHISKNTASGENIALILDNNNTTANSEVGLLFRSNVGSTNTDFQIATINKSANNADLVFRSDGATERMRITSGGDVSIGTATPIGGTMLTLQKAFAGNTAISTNTTTASTTYVPAKFLHNGTLVGFISSSTTSTAYNTTSDYRVKENVVEMTGALDRVDALKPSRFNFIADPEKTVDGFLAHEVQAIVPEAVTGEKDAVDEEGNPIYQAIDQSKIVPLLVGAIKELSAKVAALESQLNA